jgi:hypothetical protein
MAAAMDEMTLAPAVVHVVGEGAETIVACTDSWQQQRLGSGEARLYIWIN